VKLRESLFGSLDQLYHEAIASKNLFRQAQISSALIKHDHRLQNENASMEIFDNHDKFFQCMSSLNVDLTLFSERLLSDVKPDYSAHSVMPAPSSKWSSTLPLQMIESAWQLCEWSQVESLISKTYFFGGVPNSEQFKPHDSNNIRSRLSFGSDNSSSPFFVPEIGYVLLSLHNEEAVFTVEDKIADLRNSFLAPLSASLLSNHQIAYSRSYLDSIVSLHIVDDVKYFTQEFYNYVSIKDSQSTDGGNQSQLENVPYFFKEMLQHWQSRNKILPSMFTFSNQQPIHKVLEVQRSLVKILQNYFTNKKQCSGEIDCFAVELFRYWKQGLRVALEFGQLERAHVSMLEAIHLRNKQIEMKNTKFLNQLKDEEQVEFLLDSAKVFWYMKDSCGKLSNKNLKLKLSILFFLYSRT